MFEFGFSVFALWLVLHLRKLKSKYADEGMEPQPVSPIAVATGAASSIVSGWLSDHDVCNIRTNWRRRLLFGLVWNGLDRVIGRFTSNPTAFRECHSLGAAIGLVGYRLWYGLLHPLPDVED